MPNIEFTEFSAMALLFFLAIIASQFLNKWIGGYNKRAAENAKVHQARNDEIYHDNRALADALMELVRASVESNQQLAESMKALTDSIEKNNGAMADTMETMTKTLRDISYEHEGKSERRHLEILKAVG